MLRRHSPADHSILEAALIGLQHQLRQIESKIAEIRGKIGKKGIPSLLPSLQRKQRTLSAAARKRISEATKKRWAEYRKRKGKSK